MNETKLITLETLYAVVGVVIALVAGRIALNPRHPRRWGSALFWGLLAVIFLFGKIIPLVVTGYFVLGMVVLAASRQVAAPVEGGSSRLERAAEAERLQNGVFGPRCSSRSRRWWVPCCSVAFTSAPSGWSTRSRWR